jgi:hypothetical protein
VEYDDIGLERGDCQVVAVTGGLGRMDETLHGGVCVDDEAKVVDVEKDTEEGHDVSLDGIPGLVPGLVPGIQGCKSPGSLGQTWDRAKSLNFILIDSIFLLSPCPETHCHARCFPVFFKDFSEGKNIYFETPSPGFPRGKADGGCNRVPLACPKL